MSQRRALLHGGNYEIRPPWAISLKSFFETCIDCHKGIAHRLLNMSTIDPSAVIGDLPEKNKQKQANSRQNCRPLACFCRI